MIDQDVVAALATSDVTEAMNGEKTVIIRSDCPELKNQNHGNQAEGTAARGLVHALGGGEDDQDLNDMEDDIST
ncbi:hypothetical protein Tco_0635117 [Tanacetum coccineum]